MTGVVTEGSVEDSKQSKGPLAMLVARSGQRVGACDARAPQTVVHRVLDMKDDAAPRKCQVVSVVDHSDHEAAL